jgi:glycogen debranching enzyme
MQEALQRHASGVKFRERNAGPNIDRDMDDMGFNNEIGVDWKTGFVFGGNERNCGTWMDKNGSSEKAGNKGIPATPRDGSDVELVGLCASTTRWLGELYDKKVFPHEGVKKSNSDQMISYKQWAELIKQNFEKYFFIDPSPTSTKDEHPNLINRRGIYKDTLNSKALWTDYQLRPNFPIALAVAPELCKPENMWKALEVVENVLLGPLGIKTLDPSDYNYNPNYFNDDDSDDFKRAKGFNYHNGPEWVWPVGYFMRAKLEAAALLEPSRPGIF